MLFVVVVRVELLRLQIYCHLCLMCTSDININRKDKQAKCFDSY